MFFVLQVSAQKYQTQKAKDANGYDYETVKNDPLGLRIYTLKNGLKVYLSVNKDEPRLSFATAVKAGAAEDPRETTGLAHYLEHMMFKGSQKLGTTDWEKEKLLIQQISDLFEKHRKTNNPEEKKRIYAQIDSVSQIASKLAVANEYDKFVSSIGAKGTNAFTSNDQTVYLNDIPANELEKYLLVESDRFQNLVLRLFHTELETVYEEFNMSQDRDDEKVTDAMDGALYKIHPYGISVIGKGEHLKNPSMVNIMNFYHTYYVPNNIAICISGDIDFEKTIQLVDKYFGKIPANKNIPKRPTYTEAPIAKPEIREVFGPDAESLQMAFRLNGYKSEDRLYGMIAGRLLTCGDAGIIDLDLVQQQKVLNAYGVYYSLKDYSALYLGGSPREGQKLEEVKDLLLAQIEKLKKGEFDETMIQAIVNDIRFEFIKSTESNRRIGAMMNVFVQEMEWADYLAFYDKLEKVTKKQIVDFMNKNFKENYVVVYKRKGEDKNVMKVEKPKITALNINRDAHSKFYDEIAAMKVEPFKPVFVDFKKEISKQEFAKGIDLSYLKNSTNEIFYLYYIFDMGKNHNLKLSLAIDYLYYLGTEKYSPAELKRELFKAGLEFYVYSSDDKSYAYISGLDKSFEKGVELLEHIFSSAKPDTEAYKNFVASILKDRKDAKLNKYKIMQATRNFGKYGEKSPFTNILSEAELLAVNPEELVQIIKSLCSYKHQIFYYGQSSVEKIKPILAKYHKVPAELKPIPQEKDFPELATDKPKVYYVHYNLVQTNIFMMSKDVKFDKNLYSEAQVFNEYFGGNMSSIVFQEIREARALAYSAYGTYSFPSKAGKSNYVVGFVATQVDKLKTATDAMLDLMNKMPRSEKSFDNAKESLLKQIESERIVKRSIFWTYMQNKDLGFEEDIRKTVYEKAKTATIDDLQKFVDIHVKNKNFVFLIIGDKNKLDIPTLSKLGEVKELTLEQIFGY